MSFTKLAAEIWRDFFTDGLPSSGVHKPDKADIRAWGAEVENLLTPTGYLYGLTLANNGTDATNDIDVSAGKCRSDDDTKAIVLAAQMTKRLDAAWAAGSGNGGLDTGAIANGTYHVWLIATDTGVADVLLSASAAAPTMPATYTKKRRVGSILRESGAIVLFTQRGREFLRKASALDVNVPNPGTAALPLTLSVPAGIRVWALVRAGGNQGGAFGTGFLFSSLDQNDEVPGSTNASGPRLGNMAAATLWALSEMAIATNTSRQIRGRIDAADVTGAFLTVRTIGWVDPAEV